MKAYIKLCEGQWKHSAWIFTKKKKTLLAKLIEKKKQIKYNHSHFSFVRSSVERIPWGIHWNWGEYRFKFCTVRYVNKTRVRKTNWRPRWRLFSKLSGKLIQDKPSFRLVSSLFNFLSFWIQFLEEMDFICCKAPCLNCLKVQWLYDNCFFFFGPGGFPASLDLLCRAWFSWFLWIFLRSAN